MSVVAVSAFCRAASSMGLQERTRLRSAAAAGPGIAHPGDESLRWSLHSMRKGAGNEHTHSTNIFVVVWQAVENKGFVKRASPSALRLGAFFFFAAFFAAFLSA